MQKRPPLTRQVIETVSRTHDFTSLFPLLYAEFIVRGFIGKRDIDYIMYCH